MAIALGSPSLASMISFLSFTMSCVVKFQDPEARFPSVSCSCSCSVSVPAFLALFLLRFSLCLAFFLAIASCFLASCSYLVLKISGSRAPSSLSILSTEPRFKFPSQVKYIFSLGSITFQMSRRISILFSLTSRHGRCGRKSLPQKKHMNTQSSIARSRSKLNGSLGTHSSAERYSLRTLTCSHRNGFWAASCCCICLSSSD